MQIKLADDKWFYMSIDKAMCSDAIHNCLMILFRKVNSICRNVVCSKKFILEYMFAKIC